MKRYNVTGMSCAACSARVEKAVSGVDGVESCSVNLLTGAMSVEGSASPDTVIKAVTDAGYNATLEGSKKANDSGKTSENERHEIKILRNRLIWSGVFLIVLMYFSMGHMMWGWYLPEFISNNHMGQGIIQLLLTVIIMVINNKFFVSGFRGLAKRAPNMDTLVALGSSAAFIYSTYALLAMSDAYTRGDMSAAMSYMHEFYFESAAMILTLITLGKMLEAMAKGKTTDALKGLMKLAPDFAHVLKDGKEFSVKVSELKKGDIFVVYPGENIPVDGIITDGNTAVDESALTGESIPADKEVGDRIYAATNNKTGHITCEATEVGEDTTLSKIIKMVSDASSTKAPIAKVADKVSGVFVPVVMVIALISIVAWLIVGRGVGFALARGISVLVISCPCALGLATPVAIMVGSGRGAKSGILFKTAISLEQTGKADIVVLDKTGTITMGEPSVTDVILSSADSEEELVRLAYSIEKKSEHPLAHAVVKYAEERRLSPYEVREFAAMPGNGLRGECDRGLTVGGNFGFVKDFADIPDSIKNKADELSAEGKTPLFFALGDSLLGIIAVADRLKEESPEAIEELEKMGLRVVMLTGDNEKTARAIGRAVGIDEIKAGVLPDGKENVIRELQKEGKVIMVGDGINDAPALTRADIGIAIGAGADIAIDAADAVIVKSRLSDVPAAVKLSRATLRNIHENLFWAFIYNIIGIPLAAGVWIPIVGWQLNPMFGAAAMSLSSFCVVTNALRLNLFNPNKPVKHKKRAVRPTASVNVNIKAEQNNNESNKLNIKEKEKMEVTLKIEGMMCGHCEARVKKCLEAVDGVTEAEVSHEKGNAIVRLSHEVDVNTLKSAIEEQGYKVL